MSINNSAIKRIAKDVKYILNNGVSLSSENIYYKHDEENMMKGYALIIGQKDSPYGYGYYFFEFIFPDNYPFSPPEVRYLTNDGHMRFNPNLYINGKVCLSILNTWAGESWTSCQTIFSILLTLSSVLCDNPLLNEPGIKEGHNDIKKYNFLVTYKNIEFSICKIIEFVCNYETNSLASRGDIAIMYKFKDIICETFLSNKGKIIEYININKIKFKNYLILETTANVANVANKAYLYNINISVYDLNYELNYDKLEKLILDIIIR